MKTTRFSASLTLLIGCVLLPGSSALPAQNAPNVVKPHAGMLRYPCVSAKQIAFVYANKLWIVPREGGIAIPLASPPGRVMLPKFNADGTVIAFTGNYDGNPDIYTIPVEGGVPARVTHHPAAERLCNWTPDGKLLFATNGFSGQPRQDRLYIVPPTGGLPAKLPVPYGDDAAISPDGRYLAYTPSTTNFRTWKRYRGGWAQDIWLFDLNNKTAKKITDWEGTDTLPMWQSNTTLYYLSDGGPEHRLNIWRYDIKMGQRQQITHMADYDLKWPSIGPGPNGKGEIVFQHGADLDLLDLATFKTHAVDVRVPGDRSGLRPRSVDVSRFIEDWSISPSGNHAAIEARGDIWMAPVKEGTPRNLTHTSGVAERSPAWSPNGRWIAYLSDATGEYELYITQSDGKGETRQLTKNGNCFRFNPTWSPDSKYIAFSDKTGAAYLYSLQSGQTKFIDKDSQARAISVSWSPDSRWLAYSKSGESRMVQTIWIYSVETGQAKQVTSGMFNDSSPVFDHKGDYLYFASSRSFNPQYDDMGLTWVYSGTGVLIAAPLRKDLASPYLPKSDDEPFSDKQQEDKKAEVSLSSEPEFPADSQSVAQAQEDEVSGDWSGTAAANISFKMHLVLAKDNTVTGSLQSSMGNGDLTGTYNPATKELNLSLTLQDGTKVTITAKISGTSLSGTANVMGQMVSIHAERIGGTTATSGAAGAAGAAGKTAAAPATKVNIDFDGFEARAIMLPVRSGRFGRLAVNNSNQLIFARLGAPGATEGVGIKLFDITDEKKQEQTLVPGTTDFDITPDGKKLLVVRGPSATVQNAAPGASGESVVTSGMTTMIDPRAEWKQIFHDAWRIQRDFFYDPYMHGVNWQAIQDQYAKMLDDCADRDDVSYVIGEMIAELNVGHAYYFGGDVAPEPSVSVGMLGVDYELHDGAYRISKIYKGAPWDVDARGPLGQPGVKVKEGDYLLAVNGTPVDTSQDPWTAFQGLADRVVTLTFSHKPKMDKDAWDESVRLIGSEEPLRYRAWIEQNRAYVAQKTGGRVGYIYVPDTGTDGQDDLMRQFMGQFDKDALIIDERWNSGGQIPDRFIELLNRPVMNYYARRDGADWPWPPFASQGPKCMLINGEAGSGGDAFPWMFRHEKLGKLIGMRTWGGLVGLSGNPGLIDGGITTAPAFAFYKLNGTWGIEGNGVDPDIQVIDDPSLMVDGGDPQLDAGIKEMLDELKAHPYIPPKRPPYPNKSGMGMVDKDK